jgi:predicted HAD superfamily Cof-like phosphohydrolase
MLLKNMPSNYINRAKIFRKAMEQPMDCMTREIIDLQDRLIAEEADELHEALDECYMHLGNKRAQEAALKELTDLVVVCFQMAAAFGWDLDAAYNRVMDSNMSKLVDGKAVKREDGKVLKGPNYQPPVLIDLV